MDPQHPPASSASRARFASVAVVLALGGIVAFAATRGDEPSGRPTAGRPAVPTVLTENCYKEKPAIALPSWYPQDLPMPDGSYPFEIPEATSGLRRIIFSAKGTLQQFVTHALGEWPKHDWTLGVGESEPGEAEDNFLKGERYGIFRATAAMCDQSRTWVLIVLNDPSASNAPTPGFNTANPSVTPSPLRS